MKSKVIYLASPYNHELDSVRIRNYEKVSEIAAEIVANGGVALSPITYGHTLIGFRDNFPYDWPFWSNFCLSFLAKCDELYVIKMNGWDLSRGVAEEIKYAEENNIPITYIDYVEIE